MAKDKKLKLIKVTYFDEIAAIDYLDSMNSGHLERVFLKESNTETAADATAKAGVKAKIGFFNWFRASTEAEAGSGISSIGKTIINTKLSSTILSEFVVTAQKDKQIKLFKKGKVFAEKDTLSFIKSYTPYLLIIKDDQLPAIALSKFNEALESAKGYFELVLVENSGDKKIMRFNNKAFRNNYSLSDLTKMELDYFGVLVGHCEYEKIKMANEFDMDKNTVTAESILKKPELNIDDIVEIYDIILAGVSNE